MSSLPGRWQPNETGWDWLSVQLGDGAELMLYRLRHADGSIDPYSSGSYVDASGKSQFLSAKDFVMTPAADTWTVRRPRRRTRCGGTCPFRA
jgi:predicted secreted hydrolase